MPLPRVASRTGGRPMLSSCRTSSACRRSPPAESASRLACSTQAGERSTPKFCRSMTPQPCRNMSFQAFRGGLFISVQYGCSRVNTGKRNFLFLALCHHGRPQAAIWHLPLTLITFSISIAALYCAGRACSLDRGNDSASATRSSALAALLAVMALQLMTAQPAASSTACIHDACVRAPHVFAIQQHCICCSWCGRLGCRQSLTCRHDQRWCPKEG